MKLLKYIIFFSIFWAIFLGVYRNCDNKGLVRYLISLKSAILMAAILVGLIPNSVQAGESDFSHNSFLPRQERIIESLRAGFLSMPQRDLQPHEVDKTIFKSDQKLSKEYDKLVKSNRPLKQKFDALEKQIRQGHFDAGREKGLQKWNETKHIYYLGSQGDGARIYFKFVPDKFKVEILNYSNKSKQTSLTKRMERLYDN